jgi:hypothetical protein
VNPGGGTSADVYGYRRHAYLSSHRGGTCASQGVRVYDLADPRKPEHVSTFADDRSDPHVDGSWTEKTIVQHVQSAAFTGDLAVTSFQACFAGGFQGFGLYDVSDPGRPRKLSLQRTEPRGSHEIWLQPRGSRAYVYTAIVGSELRSSPDYNPSANTARTPGEADFRIYDVTDPARPVKVGEWGAWRQLGIHPTDGRGVSRANIVHSVITNQAGTRAFLSYWDLGTVILDVSDPSRPRYVGRTSFGRSQPEGDAHSAALGRNGNLLVETHETRAGVPTLFDISKPQRPRRLADFRLPAGVSVGGNDFTSGVHDPKILGNRAYFSWYRNGVVVADISRPARPRFLARFVPSGSPMVWGVFAEREYVLASDMNSGLWVLRLQQRTA